MLFSSPVFLFLFLPLVILAYYSCPHPARNTLLLVFSLFFYAWGEMLFVLVMLASVVANYGLSLLIDRSTTESCRKLYLVLAVLANLSLLGFFKYANFFVENTNTALTWLQLPRVEWTDVHLPLGISFFTFQALSYIIDVYRRDATVQPRFSDLALYIALFPQLIAGPIVRYHDVALQITSRTTDAIIFASGVRRFIMGLAKKMLIANPLGEVADSVFAIPGEELTIGLSWLGILCYTLQIYFDFSGYSDMAIGLGRMFGFRFLENFDYPYISRSIQEFWRRWHISLSRWFRDYLYIPLGGNRVSPSRVYVNLFIVFVLCGFWHGASWNFVVWGVIHGGFLVVERLGLARGLEVRAAWVGHVYTLLVVVTAWVFFRAEDLPYALQYLEAMYGFGQGSGHLYYPVMYLNGEVALMMAVGAVLATPVYPALRQVILTRLDRYTTTAYWLVAVPIFGLFLLAASQIAASSYNPFIYFRF